MTTFSSRKSTSGAGWDCQQQADLSEIYRPEYQRKVFSWMDPRNFWLSRNHASAKIMSEFTNMERRRWCESQRLKGIENNWRIEEYKDRKSVEFFMLGDTGEGDDSQYHLVRPLLSKADNIDFTVIASDVIYPAGDAVDYVDKFYVPYRDLPGKIFAIPGNHDWYDGLQGFMVNFCDADPDLRPEATSLKTLAKLKNRVIWRNGAKKSLADMVSARDALRPCPGQPGPYFVIELPELMIVGIDTGINGSIDIDQASWLLKVSREPKNKVLVSGKPLISNATRRHISAGVSRRLVNDIVEDPRNKYIATIAGDTHNYQRYPERFPDGRCIQHIVTGAGGAYTKATHSIPLVTQDNCGCTENEFRCYPLRGDSLAAYSILCDKRLYRGKGKLTVPYNEAAQFMAEYLQSDNRPIRSLPASTTVSPNARRSANIIMKLTNPSGLLQKVFSEYMDWDAPNPPLFKSFLHVEATSGRISIRCYAATGCKEHASNPPLEDHFWCTFERGSWTWHTARIE